MDPLFAIPGTRTRILRDMVQANTSNSLRQQTTYKVVMECSTLRKPLRCAVSTFDLVLPPFGVNDWIGAYKNMLLSQLWTSAVAPS